MLEIVLGVFSIALITILSTCIIGKYNIKRTAEKNKKSKLSDKTLVPNTSITFLNTDLLKMQPWELMEGIENLIAENVRLLDDPDFQYKYKELVKEFRDNYCKTLMEATTRDKKAWMDRLHDTYRELSEIDILIKVLTEMQYSNKDIALILGLKMPTLKKRKLRMVGKQRIQGEEL